MRTLIIADIHGNADALAVLPDADLVLCAGDVVTFGPQPNECIDWLIRRRAVCVRGEEDDAVAHCAQHQLPAELTAAGLASRALTRAMLSPDRLAWLAALPPEIETVIDDSRVALVHAYPGDYNRYLGPTDDELDRITRAYPRASVIVIGHSHRQAMWQRNGKVVINPGSVGQGDLAGRASYALYDRGSLTFGSLPYDVNAVVNKLRVSELTAEAKESCIREVLRGSDRPRARLIPRPAQAIEVA